MTQPTPLDMLRWNQRYYRTWHIMEAETSLLRAWRLWRAWAMKEERRNENER
jgi:hypothetical protein